MRRTAKTAAVRIGRACAAIIAVSASVGWAVPNYKGMSYTSFNANVLGGAGSDQSLLNMSMLGTDTVAINFWWYQPTTTSTAIAPSGSSASKASIEHAIDTAHSLGMKVFLKPMLDVSDGTWRANINPSAADRDAWFASYRNFLGEYADLAEAKGVELFSIGCEFNALENSVNTARWTDLIANVRSRYTGDLTYAANHDSGGIGGGYQALPWWNQLDAIGIDAYFAVSGGATATAAQFQQAWTTRANTIQSWRTSRGLTDKKVIFTEVGTGSWNSSTQTPWEVPPQGGLLDEQEQARFYDSLLDVLEQRDWFDGAFWWNWEPNQNGAGATSFTPQFKLASDVLAEHYGGQLPAYPMTAWNSNTSGQWAGNNNAGVWSNGTPNNNFLTTFDRGAAASYIVSLTGNRTVDQIVVGSNTVTFQSNNATSRNLTADGQHVGNDYRAIVVGAEPGDVGVVNVAGSIGIMTAAAVTIGEAPGSNGTLNLLAGPTVLNVTGSAGVGNVIEIGGAGTGALNILGGADVNVLTASQRVAVAKGSIHVLGAGSTLTVTGPIVIGLGGPGEVVVADGGQVQASLLQVLANGTLAGNGTVIGDVLNSGQISPGQSPGTMTIMGDFTQPSGGKVLLELASAASFDKLVVSGDLELKGQILVELLAGFMPSAGDVFDLLDFATFGNFSSLVLPTLSGPIRWDSSQLAIDGTLSVIAVPEPTVGVMTLALAAAAAARRRRRL